MTVADETPSWRYDVPASEGLRIHADALLTSPGHRTNFRAFVRRSGGPFPHEALMSFYDTAIGLNRWRGRDDRLVRNISV